ncbi:hypothetical protein Pfo_025639 [Paulownia fortunei]|nr:hypothetical protein Pfo_025639 [Paulownia fortunei]
MWEPLSVTASLFSLHPSFLPFPFSSSSSFSLSPFFRPQIPVPFFHSGVVSTAPDFENQSFLVASTRHAGSAQRLHQSTK